MNKNYYFAILVFFIPFLIFPNTSIIRFNKETLHKLHTKNVRLSDSSNGNQRIQLQTNNYYNHKNNILYLDFEQKKSHLLRDVSGNYQIKKSNYIINEFSIFGDRAALFNRKENIISINSPEYLWPGKKNIDDFSIEFWIKPVFYYRHNSILKKYNLINGYRQGIEIYIKNQKMIFSAYNLFRNNKNEMFSLNLKSINNIERNKWSKIIVSYHANKGKLILLVNGKEEDTKFAKDNHSIWTAAINPLDRSLIQIASSYSGFLDELRISNEFYNGNNQNKFNESLYPTIKVQNDSLRSAQSTGSVVSKVIKPGSGNVSTANIKFFTQEPNDSNVNIWIRHSNRFFNANIPNSKLQWKLVKNNVSYNMNSVAWFQWKAILKSNPEGTASPSLSHIKLSYDVRPQLPIPESLKIVKGLSNEKQICLEWKQTSNIVSSNRGGYKIYIGLNKKEFIGAIPVFSNSKLIQNASSLSFPTTAKEKYTKKQYPVLFAKNHQNKIRIIINNPLLVNQSYTSNRAFPMLEENRLYYFSISSFDKNNLESKLSKPVSFYIKPSRHKD